MSKQWTPAEMGRKGGSVKSRAKAEAARLNGLKPKKRKRTPRHARKVGEGKG